MCNINQEIQFLPKGVGVDAIGLSKSISIPTPKPIPTPTPKPKPKPKPKPNPIDKNKKYVDSTGFDDIILNKSGTMPIANQIFIDNKFYKTMDKSLFLKIEDRMVPQLVVYANQFRYPKIHNIINKKANNIFIPKFGDIDFSIFDSKAISNFGNSCFFGTGLHYIFMMSKLLTIIVGNDATNYLDDLSKNKKYTDAYNNIKLLLKEMIVKTNVKNKKSEIISKDFFSKQYLNVKAVFTGNSKNVEEDAVDFVRAYLVNFKKEYKVFFTIINQRHIYNPIDGTFRSIAPSPITEIHIPYDIINNNTNGTIENYFYDFYKDIVLYDGPNAIEDTDGNYTFAYSHDSIIHLPQYLSIYLILANHGKAKIMAKPQINITLTLTIDDKITNYFLMSIIFHQGTSLYNNQNQTSGHYTVITFNNNKNNNYNYTYYSDSYQKPISISQTNKYIDQSIYTQFNKDDVPYLLLYTDISLIK